MQSLFSKITRGVVHCRRLYHHHPRGSVREHLPLQTWSRFICGKAPKVPEGEPEPLSESVYVPVPVPVSEPVPVCVAEPAHMDEPDPDPKAEDKVGEGFWDAVLQYLASILAILAAGCTISGYLKKSSGGERKKFEEAQRKVISLFLLCFYSLRLANKF